MRLSPIAVASALSLALAAACGGGSARPPPVKSPADDKDSPSSWEIPIPESPREEPDGGPTSWTSESDAGDDPSDGSTPRAADDPSSWPRHRSSVLDGPAKPARIAPGSYACRVDTGYRYRPCTVTKDDKGFTWIDMPGALVHLHGVLYDDGRVLVFDGTTGTPRPFGCFNCQERCSTKPESCFCKEMPREGSKECIAQPLKVRLAKAGSMWRGTLTYTLYGNVYEGTGDARHVSGFDSRKEKYLVEIGPAQKIPKKKWIKPKPNMPLHGPPPFHNTAPTEIR